MEWRQTFVTSRRGIKAIFTGALATVGTNLKDKKGMTNISYYLDRTARTKLLCKERAKSTLCPVSLSIVSSYSMIWGLEKNDNCQQRELLPHLTFTSVKPLFWFALVDLHLFVVRARVIVYVVYLLLRLINYKEPCKRWKSNQDFKMRRFEALSYYFNSRIYRQIKEGRGGWNPLRWSLKIVIRRILSFFHWLRAHHVTCK